MESNFVILNADVARNKYFDAKSVKDIKHLIYPI